MPVQENLPFLSLSGTCILWKVGMQLVLVWPGQLPAPSTQPDPALPRHIPDLLCTQRPWLGDTLGSVLWYSHFTSHLHSPPSFPLPELCQGLLPLISLLILYFINL